MTRPGVATRWRWPQALRDRGGAQPDRLVLIAPWVDLTSSTPGTLEAAERDPWLSYPHLAVYASFWAGSEDAGDLADPRVSPLFGDLAGLPPALMLCGTRDLLAARRATRCSSGPTRPTGRWSTSWRPA